MKQTITFFITICIISILSSCTMQKRVYRHGWNFEWNKKVIANHNASENVILLDSLELVNDQPVRNEASCLKNKVSFPVKYNSVFLAEQQPVQRENKPSIRSITSKQKGKITSFKSNKSLSEEKNRDNGNMKRHYLIPLIGFVVGVLIITMAIFLIVPMNSILGILLFFLGLLLVLFSLLKIVMILISNTTKAS